jgi:hypothetical protein
VNVSIVINRIGENLLPIMQSYAARLLAVLCVCGVSASHAQTEQLRPFILVPPEIHAKPWLPTPMPVVIGPPKSVPEEVLFLIRDLPAGVLLSEGQALSETTWIVALADAPRLKIVAAGGSAGAAEFNLVLAKYDGNVLAETKVRLIIDRSGGGKMEAPQAAAGLPDTSLSSATLADEPKFELPKKDREQLQLLMQKGDECMREGKITAARLFYQRAAESGSAPAALALGGSYDAKELSRMHAFGGVQPNAGEARKWYEMARALGAPEAGQRLVRLGRR